MTELPDQLFDLYDRDQPCWLYDPVSGERLMSVLREILAALIAAELAPVAPMDTPDDIARRWTRTWKRHQCKTMDELNAIYMAKLASA